MRAKLDEFANAPQYGVNKFKNNPGFAGKPNGARGSTPTANRLGSALRAGSQERNGDGGPRIAQYNARMARF